MKRLCLAAIVAAGLAGTFASAQQRTPYKLGTFELQGRSFVGVVLGDAQVIDLAAANKAVPATRAVAAPADPVVAAASITTFVLLWLLSRVASPPLDELVAYLSLHDKHFRPFMRGLVSVQDVVFYLSLTFVALVLTTRVLEARRWR